MISIISNTNAGPQTVVNTTSNPIAFFGNPPNIVFPLTVPASANGYFTIEFVMFFLIGTGGVDLQIQTNGFFTGEFSVRAAAGGVIEAAASIPPAFLACPQALGFQDDLIFRGVFTSVSPGPTDITFNIAAGENTAGTAGLLLPGSFAQIFYYTP